MIALKFEEVYSLFIQAKCSDVLSAEYIPAIEHAFVKLASLYPQIDFAGIKRRNACTVPETVTKERFTEIVRASVLSAEVVRYGNAVEQLRNDIDKLETVPDTWNKTKKEYAEKIKASLTVLRTQRDTASKNLTAYRNDTLTPEQESEVTKAVNQLWETQNGIPTPEQIELRLSYLLDRAFTEESKEEQFYPTPDDIIQRYMLDYDINGTTLRTLLQSNDVQVLEPSAGRGNIADMIRAASPTATIDVCEINPLRREILTLKNYNVVGSDFTQFDSGEYYDVIVMNPPFNNGMDIRHVRRAYNMLKPGGVLIALLSEGSVWSNERKEVVAFRGWLERNTEYLHLDIIRREEYNVHHDRKILINIGIVQLQKKLQQAQTVTEKTSAKELLEKYQASAIDINSQQVEQDTTFIPAEIITSNAELTQAPKRNYIAAKYFTMPFLKKHVIDGANLAIESMNNIGGFLLADGTGAGKTMQCLLVAEHFYKTTGKPVLMFTVDDRVIQSSVFADAQKLGMETPDKIVIDDSKVPKRPKNYSGLYDGEITDDTPTQVRLFRFGYKKLFPGINVCTYNELSTWQIVDKEMGQVAIAREKVKELDRRYKKLRQDLEAEGDAKFPKVNGKRTPTGYSDFIKAGKEELTTKYWNEPEHVELFKMQEALNQARKQAALLLIGDASLVIYDEAHKVKNVGKVGDATAARAEMGYAISTNVDNQMFVTATPADRAGDILYMRRAGLFANEDQFERLMNDIGYVWEEAAFNKNGQQVRAGYWKPINDYPQELIAEGMGRAFDTLTESGHMIRRELEMKNLDVQMHDIVVPTSAHSMMQAIEERLTPDEGRPNWGEIFLSQLIALEQYKLQQAIELTQEAISRGRSVIIWVSTVEEGKTETRATGELKPGAVQMLKNTLAKMYGEDKVGVIVGTKNEYEDYRRLENVADFQSRKRRILIGTITSGGTGLNLDDTVGTAPRSMIVVTSPLSFINVVQAVGRIVRANTKSRSECHFLFAQGIDVDAWLKNLLAMKFVTLNATVKGEMKALSISTMRQAENGGEDAIAALKTKDTSLQKTKHRLFSAKNMRYNGWELPGRFSIYVELSGTPKSTLISIGCKSKEQLDVWATENADFIKEYGLTVAPDENYRKYNGKYYGRKFHDRDYAECKNLWNACLNLVMPESFAYRTNTVAAFAENDVVRAAADLRFVGVAYGEQGTVTRVRKNMRTIDTKGTEVAEWFYDVDFGQDRHAKRLESRFLLNGEPKKQIIDVGMVFKNERKNSYDDGGSITTYTVIEADAYEVKFKRENRHTWKGNRYNYDTKSYYYESTSESEKEMFVEDVIKQIHAGELVCVQCGETTPPELTKPETVIEPDDVDVLADGTSICSKIHEVQNLLAQAIQYDVLDDTTATVIRDRLATLEDTFCVKVTYRVQYNNNSFTIKLGDEYHTITEGDVITYVVPLQYRTKSGGITSGFTMGAPRTRIEIQNINTKNNEIDIKYSRYREENWIDGRVKQVHQRMELTQFVTMLLTHSDNDVHITVVKKQEYLSDDDFVPNSCPPVYPNGTRCITDDCIRRLDECIENEQPTKWKNWDGATNNYTAERLQLHQHIIDDFTKNKQCEPATTQPVAILTGGASGSGKSTLLKQYVPNIQDYVIIDIDKMREYLPEYKGWNANSTQEEVKDVYNKLFDTLGNPCRYNIIVDGTMNKAKSYKPILDKLRKLGYKVLIMYVKVTKEQSIQRAMSRYQKTGRYVPKFVIDEIFMNGTAAFDELKENSDGYILIDNSGAKPVVESQTTDTLGDSGTNNETWYHGTPDATEFEKKNGSLSQPTITVTYIKNPDGFNVLQQQIKTAKENGNEALYHQLLNKVTEYKENYSFPKPLFLTNKYSVAETYTNEHRAFDYQNSIGKVYKVDVNCSRIVRIVATGDTFRFISLNKVKQGFLNSGVSESKFNTVLSMFNYSIKDNKGIKTDVIAAIGNYLKFDCIDVLGVLDSYNGGTEQSTVRMVLDPSKIGTIEITTDTLGDSKSEDIDEYERMEQERLEEEQKRLEEEQKAQNLRYDVYEYLEEKYWTKMFSTKYFTIDFDTDKNTNTVYVQGEYDIEDVEFDERRTKTLLIRVADHSANANNRGKNGEDYFLSIVITPEDTASFAPDYVQYSYTPDTPLSQITDDIDEYILGIKKRLQDKLSR